MKQFCLALLVALAACARPNDVPALREEATNLVKYYQPRLEALAHRLDRADQALKSAPQGSVGSDEANRRFAQAREKLNDAQRKVSPGPEGAVARADALAKDGDVLKLTILVDGYADEVGKDVAIVQDSLTVVENWTALARSQPGAQPAQMTEPPTQETSTPPDQPTPVPTGAIVH
jgi:hypothetical protein